MALQAGDTVHYHSQFDLQAHEHVLREEDYGVVIAEPECEDPGCVYDVVENWETAESMTLERTGRIIALDPANQPRFDALYDTVLDCWGGERLELPEWATSA